MAYTRPDLVHDAGKVNTDGTRLAGCQRGTPARSGAGVYSYTLQAGSAIDANESAALIQSNTDDLISTLSQSSDTVFAARGTTNAGVATDMIWSFVILNLSF